MQQLVDNRRQTAVQPSAANRSGGMGWPQPSSASAMGRYPVGGDHRLSREPPLTNGDPPPLMLWGEEV